MSKTKQTALESPKLGELPYRSSGSEGDLLSLSAGKAGFEFVGRSAIAPNMPVLLAEVDITAVSEIAFPDIFSDNPDYKYFRCVVENATTDNGQILVAVTTDGSVYLTNYAWNDGSHFGDVHTGGGTGTFGVPLHDPTNTLEPVSANSATMYSIIDFIDPHESTTFRPILVQSHITDAFDQADPDYVGSYVRVNHSGIQNGSADIGAYSGFKIDAIVTPFDAAGTIRIYGCNVPF